MNKKIFIILLLGLFLVTGCKEKKETIIEENGKAKEDISVADITFSDIELNFNGSVTDVTAKIKNNTKKVKNVVVTVVLKDNDGNIVKEVKQVVENLTSYREQILKTGIIGDYSYIKNVEFKVE